MFDASQVVVLRSYSAVPWWFYVYIVGMAIAIPASVVWMLVARRKAIVRRQAAMPDSPLQILEKRLASGEISAEEFQYERQLLEQRR